MKLNKSIFHSSEISNQSPINIGICFDIDFIGSSILSVSFETDNRYAEDHGRTELYTAVFTYDFKKGLLLNWIPFHFNYIRPCRNIDFVLSINDDMLISKSGDFLDDYNESYDMDMINKLSELFSQDVMQELIELIISKLSPETDLLLY